MTLPLYLCITPLHYICIQLTESTTYFEFFCKKLLTFLNNGL
ncbi:hypothetical protein [Staphylococcus phage PT94]